MFRPEDAGHYTELKEKLPPAGHPDGQRQSKKVKSLLYLRPCMPTMHEDYIILFGISTKRAS